ncbi:MAG: Na+:solute symporter [Chloroherpetonaceae bacterium]|nr:Na+:solute symporter [Chloroherpetonaceae bacterium]MDW8437663.1 sodium:solute symporter family protein [Chloroherpetonaceae bacterium]
MTLSLLDFSVIAIYLLFSLLVGVWHSRRASESATEFFLSGRKLPWWLAGTGMVATTFAADTPLAVAGIVAKNGVAGNWIWWSFVAGGMFTAFFFARLWRRTQILTDLEFIELRYGGKPASFLRGFKAIYYGLLMNCVIIGWVNLAMLKIVKIMFPEWNAELTVVGLALLTTLYSGLGGLWGVSVTDAIQFGIAMLGSIVLAVLAVQHPAITTQGGLMKILPDWMFAFLPRIADSTPATEASGVFALSASAFLAFIGVQWWASWYPGAEPGGGGYVAQRMMSAKDEKHSLFATLWFVVAHYCLRPWPWILVGLTSVVLFPTLPMDQKEDGFALVMRDILPNGLKGLLVAAFLAAYMSTLSTHLNWGASYLLNDFYKRFLKPNESEAHYVAISRLVTALVTLVALLITFFALETIAGAWTFILQCGAGVGFVLIGRWFWWRLNAWSEIAAMIAPFLAHGYLYFFTDAQFPETLFYIVGFTIAVTLAVTFLTPPENIERLKNFYRRARVGGAFWKPISDLIPEVKSDDNYFSLVLNWILGVILAYAFLFGIGKMIFGQWLYGLILCAIGVAAGAGIYYDLNRRGWTRLD